MIEINVGVLRYLLLYCCDGSRLRRAMATVADYRKWAEECFEWARQAHDESVREQYANLGKVWLEYAARAEVRSDVTPPQPTTAEKVA